MPGKVTVSTNMAGRGTDIKLGEGVDELGGLHVICTEMHDSYTSDKKRRRMERFTSWKATMEMARWGR